MSNEGLRSNCWRSAYLGIGLVQHVNSFVIGLLNSLLLDCVHVKAGAMQARSRANVLLLCGNCLLTDRDTARHHITNIPKRLLSIHLGLSRAFRLCSGLRLELLERKGAS